MGTALSANARRRSRHSAKVVHQFWLPLPSPREDLTFRTSCMSLTMIYPATSMIMFTASAELVVLVTQGCRRHSSIEGTKTLSVTSSTYFVKQIKKLHLGSSPSLMNQASVVVEDTAEGGVVVAEVQDVVEPRVTTVSLAVEDMVVSVDDRPVTGVPRLPSMVVVMVVVTPAAAAIITGGKRRARSSTKTSA